MSGYLQRLVSPAGSAAGRGLRPFVATRSPIANVDQRVGLPGFEAAGLGPQGGSVTDREPEARGAAPRWPQPHQGGTVGEVSIEEPGVAPAPAARGEGSSTHVGLHAEAPRRDREEVLGVGLPSPDRTRGAMRPRFPVSPVVDREKASPEAPERPPLSAPRAAVHSPGDTHAERSDGRVLVEAPSIEERATAGSGSASGAIGTTTRLPGEPRLSPPPPARGDEEHEGPFSTRPEPLAAQRPRLEIGTIEVEVVPPPRAEPRAPSPTRPLTAESVSQIGPLAARRPSNLRFALRQR